MPEGLCRDKDQALYRNGRRLARLEDGGTPYAKIDRQDRHDLDTHAGAAIEGARQREHPDAGHRPQASAHRRRGPLEGPEPRCQSQADEPTALQPPQQITSPSMTASDVTPRTKGARRCTNPECEYGGRW